MSSRLSGPDVTRLTRSLRAAADSGLALLYVTHRLDEIFGFADRVEVLRNGQNAASAQVSEVDHAQLVSWLSGDASSSQVDRPSATAGERPDRQLVAVDLRGGTVQVPLNFEINGGEILAVTGQIGSGVGDVAAILGGSLRPDHGEAYLRNRRLPLGDPGRLRAAGVALVPGDRQGEAVIADLSVRENLFPDRVVGRSGLSWVRRPRLERATAASLVERFRVQPRHCIERSIEMLSGGNQQKVIFARAMRQPPELLVLDNPTAGVDVASRLSLYQMLREVAASGVPILLCSNDYEEVAALASRALVLWRGSLAAHIQHQPEVPELTQASHATLRNAA